MKVSEVERAIRENPDAKAVLVNKPYPTTASAPT